MISFEKSNEKNLFKKEEALGEKQTSASPEPFIFKERLREKIQETKEKDPLVQKFYQYWFANSETEFADVKFILKRKWRKKIQKEGIIIEKQIGKDKRRTLLLPQGARIWELPEIIEALDKQILPHKPELIKQRTEQFFQLGETFKKAGLYLSEYLPDIQEGKEIAKDLANEFYNYGLSLQQRTEISGEPIPETAVLAEEDKKELDKWFLEEVAYQKRMDRLGEDVTKEQIEVRRKKLIQAYFIALARQGYGEEAEKPWEQRRGPFLRVQEATKTGIIRAMKTPLKELYDTLFERGLEEAVRELKEAKPSKAEKVTDSLFQRVGIDTSTERQKLYDVLQIPKLKQELQKARETNNVEIIAKKELEIALKIQKEVSKFPYKKIQFLLKAIRKEMFNCATASMLGEQLLNNVGIKCLRASLRERSPSSHALVFLITSDGKIYWQDFTPLGYGISFNYDELQNNQIIGKNLKGKALTVEDIVKFADQPGNKGLSFEVKDLSKTSAEARGVYLYNPLFGNQCYVFNIIGDRLEDMGKTKEAIEFYKQAILLDSKYDASFYNTGCALHSLGEHEKAIKMLKQAIALNPKFLPSAYFTMGYSLYFLGKYKEAIETYEKFKQLCRGERHLIKRVNEMIIKAKVKLKEKENCG